MQYSASEVMAMRRLPEYKPPLHSTAPPLHTEATPFVVISLPKSGSTWAWDMLNTHPRVAMDAETLFFWEKVVRCKERRCNLRVSLDAKTFQLLRFIKNHG